MEKKMRKKMRKKMTPEQMVRTNFPEIVSKRLVPPVVWLVMRGFVTEDGSPFDWKRTERFDGKDGENGKDMTVTTTVSFGEGPEARAADDLEEYDVVELETGERVLATDARVDRSKLPKVLFCYDLRGYDDDPGDPVTIERRVMVNHAGCVISDRELLRPDEEYKILGEDWGYTGDAMTVAEYCACMGIPGYARKWTARQVVVDSDNDEVRLNGGPADTPQAALESMYADYMKEDDEDEEKEKNKDRKDGRKDNR